MAPLWFLLRSSLFWFGVIWLLAGAFAATSGIAGLRQASYAAQTRREAKAVVVDKSIKRASRRDNLRTRYEIVYRFTVDGLDYQRSAEVDLERWEALTEGGPISIFYLPDAFRTSRLDEPSSSGDIVGAVLGIIVTAIGGYLVVRELRLAMAKAASPESAYLPFEMLPITIARLWRSIWSMAKIFGIVLVAIFVSEMVPPVKDAAIYIDEHQSPLLVPVVSMSVLGFILMMGGILHLALFSERSSESFSLDAMKDAWGARAYSTSVIWRRRFITAAGAAMLFFGVFGLMIVIGPSWVKLLAAFAMIYAVARIAIGGRRAKR